MKTIITTIVALTLGLTTLSAQNESTSTSQSGPEQRAKPQPPLVVTTLDANSDGVIDASEIANASAALRILDRNSDGQLTAQELRRARPARPMAATDGTQVHKRRSAGSRKASQPAAQ